jgi:hypothetical protein
MKNKKYHTVGMIPKSNRKIVEKGKIDALNTNIYERSLSWFCRDTSIKTGVVMLDLWS